MNPEKNLNSQVSPKESPDGLQNPGADSATNDDLISYGSVADEIDRLSGMPEDDSSNQSPADKSPSGNSSPEPTKVPAPVPTKKRHRFFRWFDDVPDNYDRETFRNRGGFGEIEGGLDENARYPDAELKSRYGFVLTIAAGLGLFVGFLVWFFFLLYAVGKSVIWPENLPDTINLNVYRCFVLLVGAVLVGLVQERWPGYPKGLHNIITLNRKNGNFGFDNIPAVMLATMLPLIFGSAVGPEASLMSFIATVIYFLAKKVRASKLQTQIATYIGISAGLGACFLAPLFGFMEIIEQPISLEADDAVVFPRTRRLIVYFTAIMFAIIAVSVLDAFYPVVSGVPRFTLTSHITMTEIWLFFPVVLLSALTGTLFRFFNYINGKLFRPLKDRAVLKAVICALVMSGLMIFFPLTQFTGEPQIEMLMLDYHSYTAAHLFFTVVFKLFLVSLCVTCGWRGGNLYPTVFAGICFGYAAALLFPYADAVYLVALAAGAMCGSILRKPMACAMLLLLCFPVNLIVWMFAAAFIGSLVPAIFEKRFSFF